MDRKPVTARQRFEVFKRDGFICQYCGSHPPEVILHADHITAVNNGGGNDRDNLITSCDRCNLGKSDIPLSSVPASLQSRMDELKERERQIKGYSRLLSKRTRRLEQEVWSVLEALFPGLEKVSKRDFLSVKIFVENLGVEDSLKAAEKAYTKSSWAPPASRFRYFCGICWRWIKEGVTP